MGTLNSLKQNVAFAKMDEELFLLMTDPVTNAFLEQLLIEKYFPNSICNYRLETTEKQFALEFEIKQQIVEDTKEEYQAEIWWSI